MTAKKKKVREVVLPPRTTKSSGNLLLIAFAQNVKNNHQVMADRGAKVTIEIDAQMAHFNIISGQFHEVFNYYF